MNEFKWICPVCKAEVKTLSEEGLQDATAIHILIWHEDVAGQRAVDRARLDCREVNCSLGRTRSWNLAQHEWEFRPTDFDKKFFSSLDSAFQGPVKEFSEGENNDSSNCSCSGN